MNHGNWIRTFNDALKRKFGLYAYEVGIDEEQINQMMSTHPEMPVSAAFYYGERFNLTPLNERAW